MELESKILNHNYNNHYDPSYSKTRIDNLHDPHNSLTEYERVPNPIERPISFGVGSVKS